LDMACLGFAECDRGGNINASRFANRVPGCGGFINISQNSKKVVFVGTFTSGGLQTKIANGSIEIVAEGKHRKFVDAVGQVTFSGKVAAEADQDVLYVTERCVLRLTPDGLSLSEVAPGIDIERDVLAHLPFKLIIDRVTSMDPSIFKADAMGLRDRMLDLHIEDRLSYEPSTNTIFMNYAGMRVRNQNDIDRIKTAVDKLLGPLGKRVYSIVNYDSFICDPEVMDAYMDAVRYVEERYYIGVARYTTSGFMRLKLGAGLKDRKVSSHVFESRAEARAGLKS
jgi:propionate CoA-transferase